VSWSQADRPAPCRAHIGGCRTVHADAVLAAAPLVQLLSLSTHLVLRAFGVRPSEEVTVTEEEIKLMIEQGTQEGVFEPSEQEIVERVFRLAIGPRIP